MQVIRQHDDGPHTERSHRPRRAECIAQQIDALDEQAAATLQQVDGEEIGATRHPDATVIRHAGSVPEASHDHRRRRPYARVGEVLPAQTARRWARAHPTHRATSAPPGTWRAGAGRARARLTDYLILSTFLYDGYTTHSRPSSRFTTLSSISGRSS